MNHNFIKECKTDIKIFKKDIQKGPFSVRLKNETLNSNTGIDVYVDAIYQGYLDACRTFSGTKLETDSPAVKELALQIKNFIDGKQDFSHEDLCKILLKTGITYGQAQKIVNMAFKYLCCLSGAENYGEQFSKCHMPLDSIMLEWITRKIEESPEKYGTIKRGKIPSWSAMSKAGNMLDKDGKYGYLFFTEKIDDICKAENKAPLQLDFENWRTMQLRLAAEAFLKAYYDEDNTSKAQYSKDLRRKTDYAVLLDVKNKVQQYL